MESRNAAPFHVVCWIGSIADWATVAHHFNKGAAKAASKFRIRAEIELAHGVRTVVTGVCNKRQLLEWNQAFDIPIDRDEATAMGLFQRQGEAVPTVIRLMMEELTDEGYLQRGFGRQDIVSAMTVHPGMGSSQRILSKSSRLVEIKLDMPGDTFCSLSASFFIMQTPNLIEDSNQTVSIQCKLVSGADLRIGDSNNLSDPFVVLRHSGAVAKSKVVKETLSPVWNEVLNLPE